MLYAVVWNADVGAAGDVVVEFVAVAVVAVAAAASDVPAADAGIVGAVKTAVADDVAAVLQHQQQLLDLRC